MSDQIHAIISKMTLEEKAALCTGASTWTTTPIDRLGVPEMIVSDGPHGLRRVADAHSLTRESLPATCFPTASCMAATWNAELLFEVGQALAALNYAAGFGDRTPGGVDFRLRCRFRAASAGRRPG